MTTLILGDCLDVLRTMPDASVDAVVTDPPYGLEFMGKEWDAPWKDGESWRNTSGMSKPGFGERKTEWVSYGGGDSANPTCSACGGRLRGSKKCSCTNPAWVFKGEPWAQDSNRTSQSKAFQAWCESWARECLRVLKPGGHMLAFGGTRMFHRLTCGIEDAGFEIRDCLSWLYGSGFPKSLDVSKALDKQAGAERTEVIGERHRNVKPYDDSTGWNANNTTGAHKYMAPATDAARQWQGWGTALKPAWEPILMARKPLIGTVAANVQAHETGGIHVDACRIASGGPSPSIERRKHAAPRESVGATGWTTPARPPSYNQQRQGETLGRWPANVCLDEVAAAMLDEQSGDKGGGFGRRGSSARPKDGYAGSDRDAQATLSRLNLTGEVIGYGDTGGASRFFYTSKAGKDDRELEDGTRSTHPTVKPVDLMRWLVRLVTPPGGVVLDPFMGSGSTGVACAEEGFHFIGIECEPEYHAIAVARLAAATRQGRLDI